VAHPPVRLIKAAQLAELPPTEILGNTRFVARGLNVVFGASGAFKSFYTLDAMLQVAQTQPVVYVAAEGAGGLHKRVTAWCKHNGLGPGKLEFICQEVNLLDSAYVKAIGEAVKPLQPAAVTFDTLARCIPGGDENSAKDMGVAVRNSAVLQRYLNTAIIWIHHTNRAERGERGSGAIRGAADAMIEMAASGDSVIRVSCSKLKDDEPWAAEEMRFHPIDGTNSGVLVPNLGDISKFSVIELQVLEFLSLPIFEGTTGTQTRQIVTALNISERHIYRILSHLKDELTLTHDSKGDPYRLTDKGKQIVLQRTAKSGKVLNLVSNQRLATGTDMTDIVVTDD
jgi:predicted transcriptional regulator